MSHSRADNNSADLEHLELEIAATDSPVAETPVTPSQPADPRRVSINSVDSNSSNTTVKYQHQPTPSDPVSSSYGGRPSAIRMPSSASNASVPGSRRPKSTGSYRHSTAGPPSSSSSTGYRRRPQQIRRTASTRSSIRRNNRSSDIEEEDESSNDISDELADSRPLYNNMRRANSRRSVRVNPDDEYDGRDYEGQDRHSIDYNMNEEEEDESDIEPLTLKDRQETINHTHPFGLPLWKPALYKKSRSVTRKADSALHSQPSSDLYISFGNLLWTLIFGWWLSLICLVIAVALYLIPFGGAAYGRVVLGLSHYLFWPFGQYVERDLYVGETRNSFHQQSMSTDTDRDPVFSGHGNGNARLSHLSPSEESRPLLPRSTSTMEAERHNKTSLLTKLLSLPRTIFELGLGGIVYYLFYYTIIGPLHMFVSCLCWFMVVSIPMGKFTYVLATHLHKNPLRLHFKRGSSLTLSNQNAEILLCTYDAIGLQYYKYTYDGTNIIFINLLPVVFFTIFDEYVLTHVLGHDSVLTSPAVIFSLGLSSVIPLSYFIGMAVSSISAQSSLGLGAVINATFGSIIEIILYSVALTQGKGLITEGALIGSFLAGLLLMPGMSMMSGAVKKKEQKFNAKSAGVTATMLIMSLIGVLTPTLFYSIYGRFELRCEPCPESSLAPNDTSCQRCYHHQPNPVGDVFFQKNVKPLMYFCCIILPSAYLIGIWFSLRTHVKQIWSEPAKPSVRDSSIYKKLLPLHILQQLLHYGTGNPAANNIHAHIGGDDAAEMGRVRSNSTGVDTGHSTSNYQSTSIHGGLQERPPPHSAPTTNGEAAAAAAAQLHPSAEGLLSTFDIDDGLKSDHGEEEEDEAHGGHDSPNWSKAKSATVLLGCTVLYSIIAEILVDSVDAVSSIDEKLLGLTLFALVPNVTEFMNAISFAMYGNIALSMEIGSAYALQVCLIQIPAMVAVSAWLNPSGQIQLWKHMFNMVFPRWDVFSMLFSVFLLTYTYIEGKSNYFKGSILILSYLVLMAGFYYAPTSDGMNAEVRFLTI
ncbi:Ca2+:H+ antiporter [Entomortierella parvispora]|uniref:Ca2+:H+ antiporter n=1 Tax=Entomortierella parvispora TaxID=205924 RepID=A0A9P3LWF1_9FUNG|nr:Ca2+:H+ antiporter [Entomortierella parvispora]